MQGISSSRNLVTYFLLFAHTAIFYFMSCTLVHMKKNNRPERVFKNLHSLEYPATAHDLSVISFSAPAMPSRLASTWEVRDALKLPAGVMTDASSMIYPMMERTLGMAELLQARERANNVTCVACKAQAAFDFNNGLVEEQTQHYCPKRGESQADWAKRTGQVNANDIEATFKAYSTFHYNNEHSQLCRARTSPSMVLAHVATSTFTLFSSQNSAILLLYTATVNAMFGCAIFLYRWHGSRLSQSDSEQKLELHGLFSFLFFVSALLLLIPAFTDYYERNDGLVEAGNRAVGSYVLGVWTVVFAFVYIKFFPMLIPPEVPNESKTHADKIRKMEGGAEPKAVAEDKLAAVLPDNHVYHPERGRFAYTVEMPTHIDETGNKEVVLHFVSRQPMISFAYWNLAQVPCLVMVALTETPYGVDANTQLVIFGAFAVGLLDVVHARVIVILAVLKKTAGLDSHALRWFVTFVFLFLNWCIAIPVLSVMNQVNLSTLTIIVVLLLFWTQTVQNIALCLLASVSKLDVLEDYVNTYDVAFIAGLVWQMLVSIIAFAFFFTI